MAYKPKKNQTSKQNNDDLPFAYSIDRKTGAKRILETEPIGILTRHGVHRLFSDPNTETIEALGELKNEGYVRTTGGQMNIELKCEEVLEGIGFALVDTEELSPGLANLKNFNLVGSENVDETIMNSKILDPDISRLTPVKIEAIEKIKSENDAFYELDQERADSIKHIVSKEKLKDRKKLIRVAKMATRITRKSPNKMLEKQFKLERSDT
jgi:hypothetical protein